jgi:excisionase family DNA binding protein
MPVRPVTSVRWLNATQAAGRLGVTAPTLRKWVDNGSLPYVLTAAGQRVYSRTYLDYLRAARSPEGAQQGTPAARWLSAEVAADWLGVSRQQIIDWGDAGRIMVRMTSPGFWEFATRDLAPLARPLQPARIWTLPDIIYAGRPMTSTDFLAERDKADGRCAACGLALTGEAPVIECDVEFDGTFRQLLCSAC